METSKTGVFFDTKAGKVVNAPPEAGVQLVAPGAEIDAATAQRIAVYKGEHDEDGTVTTARAKGKAE